MAKKYGFSENELASVMPRDMECVYCGEKMLYPYDLANRKKSATLEHLNHIRPFYKQYGLLLSGLTYCCGSCNSSRGKKSLFEWFAKPYCSPERNNINRATVAEPVRKYIERRIAEGAEW